MIVVSLDLAEGEGDVTGDGQPEHGSLEDAGNIWLPAITTSFLQAPVILYIKPSIDQNSCFLVIYFWPGDDLDKVSSNVWCHGKSLQQSRQNESQWLCVPVPTN